jgi:hypothetical protein
MNYEVKEIKEKRIVECVRQSLYDGEYGKDIKAIRKLASNRQVIAVGGYIRDRIIELMHNISLKSQDLDIAIDDQNRRMDFCGILGKEFDTTKKHSFGTPRISLDDKRQIDIMAYTDRRKVKQDKKRKVDIFVFLRACDITTSSVAFDFHSEKLYSCNALEGILKGELDIVNPDSDTVSRFLGRLPIHANKLGFDMGPNAKKFVNKHYLPNDVSGVNSYLEYKGKIQYLDIYHKILESQLN